MHDYCVTLLMNNIYNNIVTAHLLYSLFQSLVLKSNGIIYGLFRFITFLVKEYLQMLTSESLSSLQNCFSIIVTILFCLIFNRNPKIAFYWVSLFSFIIRRNDVLVNPVCDRNFWFCMLFPLCVPVHPYISDSKYSWLEWCGKGVTLDLVLS